MTATQTWNTTELVEKDKAHLLHPVSNLKDMRTNGPLILAQGEGVYLWDTDGKQYIDAFAGLWNVNVGHGRRVLGCIDLADVHVGPLSEPNYKRGGRSHLPFLFMLVKPAPTSSRMLDLSARQLRAARRDRSAPSPLFPRPPTAPRLHQQARSSTTAPCFPRSSRCIASMRASPTRNISNSGSQSLSC